MSNFIKIKSTFLLLACLTYVSQANATVSPDGCYELDTGKATLSASIPSILTLSASLPALGLFGLTNSFSDDGSFSMPIPALGSLGSLSDQLPTELNGTWQAAKAPNFNVKLTALSDLTDQLESSLGISTHIDQSFSVKVTDKIGKKISGKFTISLTATMQETSASAKITGTFTAVRVSTSPCPSSTIPDEE